MAGLRFWGQKGWACGGAKRNADFFQVERNVWSDGNLLNGFWLEDSESPSQTLVPNSRWLIKVQGPRSKVPGPRCQVQGARSKNSGYGPSLSNYGLPAGPCSVRCQQTPLDSFGGFT